MMQVSRAARSIRLRTMTALLVVAVLPACAMLGADTADVPAPGPSTVAVPDLPLATPPPADDLAPPAPDSSVSELSAPESSAGADGDASAAEPLPDGVIRPPWLGARPLPLGPDGNALPQPTPDELVVRRVPTIDLLPPPPADAPYRATIDPLSDEVVARSTWNPDCPVPRDDLRLLTMSFWGFDDRPHTGEMIVHADWAEAIADIFGQLFDARFPIEEMRVVAAEELDAPPTGDGNNTTSFVCRPVRGASSWSQHAFGLAIDINPFMNPFLRGQRLLPELSEAYLDRSHDRPGMIHEGTVPVQAFDAIGWGWGGRWSSLIDWMHFSANGR